MAFPTKDDIETESVEFNGYKYNRYPNSERVAHQRYFMRAGGKHLLHRDVWEFYNGAIPDGYHVHHKDGDWNNNDISNLECLPAEEHYKEHYQYSSEFNSRPEQLEHLERIRPQAAAWHSSEEGRAWHDEHAKETVPKMHEGLKRYQQFCRENPTTKTCTECGKTFTSPSPHAEICSNTCACRRYRRRKREANRV